MSCPGSDHEKDDLPVLSHSPAFVKPAVDRVKLAEVMDKARSRDVRSAAALAVRLPAILKRLNALPNDTEQARLGAQMGLYLDSYGPAGNIEFRQTNRYGSPPVGVYATEDIDPGLTQHAIFDMACAAAKWLSGKKQQDIAAVDVKLRGGVE